MLRWVSLAVAVAALVVFAGAQRQSADVSFESPAPDAAAAVPDSGGGSAAVPSVAELTRLVRASPVVRLPGAIAQWDAARVRAAAGDLDVRILVAPPDLDDAARQRVADVDAATVTIVGTQVGGGLLQAVGDSLDDWRAQFATADVTNQIVTLVAGLRKQPTPADVDGLRWREPTAAELAGVARRTVPTQAFPGGSAMVVVLPRQPFGKPVPRYGPALARRFPGTPIVVQYGDWVEYHGPQEQDFAEVAGASFYARFGDLLARRAFPQQNVLTAYLNQVADIRYAGVFDRPLPYRPADPVRVALPVLPWLFVACVLLFFALSLRTLLRPVASPARDRSLPARLAGLSALAVEMSALTDDPALTRALVALTAARSALDDDLTDASVRAQLRTAEAELDHAARRLPYPGYRPADYLRERLA
ncbi:hypothetical protein L083_5359 [Actinoplanes sp. N902-109]|nr:hypothetical protein L083_5359 [Actinoplanes sp. N902-109]